jgi:aerobic-type carbon monoxide dehydrogenase small subunit (CoxS/CutS family)
MELKCKVNEQDVQTDVPARLLLSDFLRHELRLTGTHVGCEMGACGACTVMLDGQAVRSCLTFAVQADGCLVRTVEGIAPDGRMADVQEAFRNHHALQCGFCTPGILMTVVAAMERSALPATEQGVRELLSGNICRCTGYQGIVDAVLELAAGQAAALEAPVGSSPSRARVPSPRFTSLSPSRVDGSSLPPAE